MTGVRLPEGRHFALTWSIPDTFGGMTDAMLRRSAAFHRLGSATVDVLTFDTRPDTPEIELELRQRGVLVDGVRITNLYDWLRGHPLPGGALRLERDAFTPLRANDDAGGDGGGGDDDGDAADAGTGRLETRLRGDVVMSRSRVDADGRTLQVDHYRADGTLLLSDRRDTRVPGVIGGRSVVLCDAEGRPVRSWRGIRPLYRAWIDALTDGRPSHLIIDSKTVAPLLLGYRRPHVVTAHVVHASHRSADSEPHPIRRSRREVFEQLDDFDLVVLLSRRQRDDVERIVGRHDHLTVIPNSRPLPPRSTPESEPRDPGRGVVLAALTRRKRVSHAIDAVQRANTALAEGGRADPPVRLDVFGDGESRTALERRITDRAAVRLHGFQPDARSRLRGASFLLLTSHSEGFPLVLVEAMAAGCLPIAYDSPTAPPTSSATAATASSYRRATSKPWPTRSSGCSGCHRTASPACGRMRCAPPRGSTSNESRSSGRERSARRPSDEPRTAPGDSA